MAILFASDLHLDKGIWIDICLNFLDELEAFSKSHNIHDVVIGGDVFEKATKIKHEAFIPLFLKFLQMKSDGFNLYFILGNHDIFNDDNDSIVETFLSFGKVIKESETLEIDGYQYDLLSYTKDETKIPNKSKVLLTHLSIADFQFDNGYEVDQKNGMPTDLFSHYDLVVSGHFHRMQKNKNIFFPGSPFQHNFGEEGQKKGFAVIDKNEFSFVEYTGAPTHLTIKIEDFDKHIYTNKFVQVEITDKIETFVKLKHLLYSKGAIEVKPFFKKQEETFFETKNGLKIDASGSVVSSIKEYLQSIKLENLDNKKLIDFFNELVGELK